MALNWHIIWQNPWFKLGLAIKLLLIIALVPEIQTQWFAPFLINAIENPSLNPWSAFVKIHNSDILSFPYGYMMLLVNLPMVFLGWLFDILFHSHYFALFGIRVNLLLFDLLLFIGLVKIYPNYIKNIVLYYWLSPLALYISYWHGQLDVIPVTLLVLSFLFLKTNKVKLSALLVALAISAKLSMIIVVPFFLIYLWINKKFRHLLIEFVLIMSITTLILYVPIIFSEGFITMVLENREVYRIYLLQVPITQGLQIYVVPLIYLLMLYLTWRIRRINFDLMVSIIGVSFVIIIITTPPAIGWYFWIIPFIAIHQLNSKKSTTILVLILSALIVVYHFIYSSGANIVFSNIEMPLLNIQNLINPHIQSIWLTIIIANIVILAIQMLREGIYNNDNYQISKTPISIAISGAKNSGKHTLLNALIGLFGKHSVAQITEDNYHIWDKNSPMWQTLSVENPKTSDLFQFTKDAIKLIKNHTISTKTDMYNTNINQLKTIHSNDIVIVSGCHTLYSQTLRKNMSLGIYLEINDTLEQYFTAKEDHQTLSKEQCKADIKQYVHIQKQQADIVFYLDCINKELLINNNEVKPYLKLTTTLKNGIFYQSIVKILVGVCNLHVNVDADNTLDHIKLDIEGDVDTQDIELSVNKMMPNIGELLDLKPEYRHGMLGIMQLIILMHIHSSFDNKKS